MHSLNNIDSKECKIILKNTAAVFFFNKLKCFYKILIKLVNNKYSSGRINYE